MGTHSQAAEAQMTENGRKKKRNLKNWKSIERQKLLEKTLSGAIPIPF